ncbi:MAG: NUDIX domain-containing protein [Trueperaceae bacterium]|nr:NUDIX domain-containing protein [Trueperaceae bacterium]
MADDTELLDLLDDQGALMGRTKSRADVHRDGDWHRAFHLWVMHPDGYVLLQRRSRTKDLAPGKVDVSVGGHLRAGEIWLDALREAEEEIGLELRPGDVDLLGTVRSERAHPDGSLDREFQDVYTTVVEGRGLPDYRLRCDEVAVLYEAPLARVIELYRDGRALPVAGWDCQQRRNDALLVPEDLIAEGREGTLVALGWLAAWWAARARS